MQKYFQIEELPNLNPNQIFDIKDQMEKDISDLSDKENELKCHVAVEFHIMHVNDFSSSPEYERLQQIPSEIEKIKKDKIILSVVNDYPNLLKNGPKRNLFIKLIDYIPAMQIKHFCQILNIKPALIKKCFNLIKDTKNLDTVLTYLDFCCKNEFLQQNPLVLDKLLDVIKKDNLDIFEQNLDTVLTYLDFCCNNEFLQQNPLVLYELFDIIKNCDLAIFKENMDIFECENILENSVLRKEIFEKFKYYCQNENKQLKDSSKKRKMNYLTNLFYSSGFYGRIETIKAALKDENLKEDYDLLVSMLSAKYFVKAIIRRKQESAKLVALKDIISSKEKSAFLDNLYFFLQLIIPENIPLDKPYDYFINNLLKSTIKDFSYDSFLRLSKIVEQIKENIPDSKVIHAAKIIERTPVLCTNPDYLWALLLKEDVESQTIFEQFMQNDEVRSNFTYNQGDSLYGKLLSMDKPFTTLDDLLGSTRIDINLYDLYFYFKNLNRQDTIFAKDGLNYYYEYDNNKNTTRKVKVIDLYKATLELAYKHHWPAPTSEKELNAKIQEIRNYSLEEVKQKMAELIPHDRDAHLTINVFESVHDTILECAIPFAFELYQDDRVNEINSNIYTNSNQRIRKLVNQMENK